MKKFTSLCKHTIDILGAIISLIILIVCLFFNHIDYAYKKVFLLPNIILLTIGLAFIYLGYSFLKKFTLPNPHIVNRFVFFFTIAFFFFLCFLSSQYYFITGWDVKYVLNNSELMAEGRSNELEHWYFSRYPNNILLAFFFSLIIRICTLLHINNYYLVLIFAQCMIFSYISWILYRSVLLILNNYCYALTAYTLYLAFIGLSPWVVIPYSDSIGLFFVLTIFYLYLKFINTDKLSTVFLITLLTYLGFKIKPQTAIITIAIFILSLCRFLDNRHSDKWKSLAKSFISATLGLFLAFLLVQAATLFSGLKIEKEDAFSFTHYIMMGLNQESNGEYYQPDVDFSVSFPTRSERIKANLSVAQQRISHFSSLKSFFRFIAQKLLAVYNDGSFAWNGEGYFFLTCFGGGYLHKIMTHIYYPDGKLYSVYLSSVQSLWLAVLFLSAFVKSKDTIDIRSFSVITLKMSLTGLFLFELLFEARARYLFTYSPIFIIMACLGLYSLNRKYYARKSS